MQLPTTYHITTHHRSTSHTSLITAPLLITTHHRSASHTLHRASWRSCGARDRRWPAAAFRVARAVHRASWRSCGTCGRRWPAAAFRVAGAVHRASWKSCGARGRRWPAAACLVAGAVHRASWRSCGARGRRWPAAAFRVAGAVHRASWLPFVWQAQYTELPGQAAARVAAAGPRLPFVSLITHHSSLHHLTHLTHHTTHQSLHHFSHLTHHTTRVAGAPPRRFIPQLITPNANHATSNHLSHHNSSPLHFSHLTHHSSTSHHNSSPLRFSHLTQSLLEELRRAWPPLACGCLSCGRRSTQSLLEELRRAWPPLARGCLSRGRRSTQSLLEEAARVAAAGPRLPFVWQAQCTELPGCLSCGRRSTQSFLDKSLHHFSHLTHHTTRVAGAVHRASWPAAAPLITTPLLTSHSSHHACGRRSTQSLLAYGCLSCGRRNTQSFLAAFRAAGAIHRASWTSCGARGRCWPAAACRFTHHTPPITAPLITSHSSHHSCGRRSTQSLLEELRRVAGAVHRASWRRCGARGRRWAAAAFRVAGAARRASRRRAGWRVAGAAHRASWRSSGLVLTPSFTHNFVTHHLWHTTLSHTIFHTPSFTHHLCHTTLSNTLFHTPSLTPHLWHTPSFTPRHRPSFTHHLSPHHLCHTPSFTTPSFTHTTLSHTIFPPPPPLSFLPSPSPLQRFWLITGRSWLVGLSGPLIYVCTLHFYASTDHGISANLPVYNKYVTCRLRCLTIQNA